MGHHCEQISCTAHRNGYMGLHIYVSWKFGTNCSAIYFPIEHEGRWRATLLWDHSHYDMFPHWHGKNKRLFFTFPRTQHSLHYEKLSLKLYPTTIAQQSMWIWWGWTTPILFLSLKLWESYYYYTAVNGNLVGLDYPNFVSLVKNLDRALRLCVRDYDIGLQLDSSSSYVILV